VQTAKTTVNGINAQTGTNYTLVLADGGKVVEMNNAAANSVYIPADSVVNFPINTVIIVSQMGLGMTTIVPNGGVTARTATSFTVLAQYDQVTLRKRAANDWIVFGRTSTNTTTGNGGTSTGGSGTSGSGTGTGTGTTVGSGSATPNLIPTASVQNASAAGPFTAAAGAISLDTTIYKSGTSSLKFTPNASSAYPYVLLAAPLTDGAPVTVNSTYTTYLSVRPGSGILSQFRVYPTYYDSNGTQTLGTVGPTVTMVAGSWTQAIATGTVPTGTVRMGFLLEVLNAGLTATDTFNFEEIGINAGTTASWSSSTPTVVDPQTSASVTDAGFGYNGAWQSVTSPSEHYSSVVGDTATLNFTVGTGGSTLSIIGVQDTSNGAFKIAIDGGTQTTVSENGANQQQTTFWTSGTLAAGQHTAVITVATPDVSIQGASLTRGSFTAPAGSTGGSGTGTTPPTTGTGGGTIGGGSSSSNPSGQSPPTATAFSGFTRVYVEDYNTDVSLPNFGVTAYQGQNGYEGITSGASGTKWTSKTTTTVSGGAVHLRNFMQNGVAQCGALTPLTTNPSASWNQQGQLYGKWVARIRSSSTVGFKVAFLLWPTSGNWPDGEIDYPEANLNGTVGYSTHNVVGNPEDQVWGYDPSGTKFGDGQWHTYTFTWTSTAVTFELDGKVIKTVTDSSYIPKNPMRWDLQCEISTDGTKPTSSSDGTVDVDWIAQYRLN
jgi:hypothetical protein